MTVNLELIKLDMDEICISNINRQIHALTSTIGKFKIQELEKRLLDINPDCSVTLLLDFINSDNALDMLESLDQEITICVDAIDQKYEKAALIAACSQLAIPIITCGSSSGRTDPTFVTYNDLTKVTNDRLLFGCRKILRQQYHFRKGPKPFQKNTHKVPKWNVLAVFSMEQVTNFSEEQSSSKSSSFRRCDNGFLGTACFVTGTFGFVAASQVVSMIVKDELLTPIHPSPQVNDTLRIQDNMGSKI